MIGLDRWLAVEECNVPTSPAKPGMKRKLIGMSQRYVAALRRHLKLGPRASLQPASRLGQQAVALGLETPELARIHERALAALEATSGKKGLLQRARIFFTEAVIPVVQTHRAVMQSQSDLARLKRSVRHDIVRRG